MSERPAIIKSKDTQDVANESLLKSKFISTAIENKITGENTFTKRWWYIFWVFSWYVFIEKYRKHNEAYNSKAEIVSYRYTSPDDVRNIKFWTIKMSIIAINETKA